MALCLASARAEPFRSNGKGGGPWSAPTTWEGGSVPAAGSVVILGGDVVDLDAAAGNALQLDELVIDPRGVLRVVGDGQRQLCMTFHKSLRVFGGLKVDFSSAAGGRCEFVWPNADGVSAEFLLSERSRAQIKGAGGEAPNVFFRVVAPTNMLAGTIPQAVPLTIGPKTWFEAIGVQFEGFGFEVRGVDGSGTKFNEQCLLRHSRFLRGAVQFLNCTKIEFDYNYLTEPPYPHHGLVFNSTTHSRFRSNRVENCHQAGIAAYGSVSCEVAGNQVSRCGDGLSITACTEVFIRDNLLQGNRGSGVTLNTCNRITAWNNVFDSNQWLQVRAINTNPNDVWRLYDCRFLNSPTNVSTAALSVEGIGPLELINTPIQSLLTASARGLLLFSAYVDVFVTNETGTPLGRVLVNVRSGDTLVATSRTEAGGPRAGHTPLPSSRRPLIVPWFRYNPSEGGPPPAPGRSYTLEVDGSHLGYAPQTVPLVVDETFLRPDPDKPTKTVTVKLSQNK